jgi:NDP-sugar pyrophosphorylase family protein
MKVELIIAAEMSGTADGLRAVAERIRGDFIYISADIISQFGLIDLVNLHRSSVSDMTILFSVPTNKESIKDDVDQEYIGITKEGRVLLKSSTLELEDEGITLSKALLFKASSPLSVRNDLMDVGVYIFSYWILEFIKSTKRISSIKSDLLPYLIHRQFQSQEYLYEKFPSLQFRKRPLNYLENWLIQNNNSSTSSEHHWNNNQIPAGNSYQTISDYEKNYLKLSNNDCLRCFGLIYGNSSNNTNDTTAGSNTAPSFMLSRVHTIPTYLTLNK